MGWSSYGIYGGDDTQSRHYDFIKWAKIKGFDYAYDSGGWLLINKTKIPKNQRQLLNDNFANILNKMLKQSFMKKKYMTENSALEWQMLAALFMDNDVQAPLLVYEKAMEGTNYLMGDHSDEFDNPSRRRQVLKYFNRKLKKNIEKYYPKTISNISTTKIGVTP